MSDRQNRKNASPRTRPGTHERPETASAAGVPEIPGLPRRPDGPETDAERRRRRAQFLRELAEARQLRDRVQPRRVKTARLRHAMRMRTFRW
ncbi:hypothetical protein ACWD0J_20135 [Streptomyces sp. NPDC003011]